VLNQESDSTLSSRLSRIGNMMRKRGVLTWRGAVFYAEYAQRWLIPRRRMLYWGGGGVVAAIALLSFLFHGGMDWFWRHDFGLLELLLAAGLAILTGFGAYIALAYEGRLRDQAGRLGRLTRAGWIAAICFGCSVLVGIGKEFSAFKERETSQDESNFLREKVVALGQQNSELLSNVQKLSEENTTLTNKASMLSHQVDALKLEFASEVDRHNGFFLGLATTPSDRTGFINAGRVFLSVEDVEFPNIDSRLFVLPGEEILVLHTCSSLVTIGLGMPPSKTVELRPRIPMRIAAPSAITKPLPVWATMDANAPPCSFAIRIDHAHPDRKQEMSRRYEHTIPIE
jgi:hypothetical protein